MVREIKATIEKSKTINANVSIPGVVDIPIDELVVNPLTTQQKFEKSIGAYNPITVNAVTASIDSNIKAENIKSGVSILGVNGTCMEVNNTTLTATNNGTYTPSSPYTGYSQVVVNTSSILITKTITTNGTYNASSDNADGYSSVVVDLPLAAKTITTNGTYLASTDNLEGFSSVTVNVPSGMPITKDNVIRICESEYHCSIPASANYTKYNSPSAVGNIVSLSSGSYQCVETNDTFNFNNANSWSIITRQSISSYSYSDNGFMGTKNGGYSINCYASNDNKLHFQLSSDGSSWDIGELSMQNSFTSDTLFYTKLEFTGSAYNLYYGTLLNNLQVEATISSSTKVSSISGNWLFGIDSFSTINSTAVAIDCTFDMEECFVYMNNSLAWTGTNPAQPIF